MNKCPECGGKIVRKKLRKFRDDELLGLPGVLLVNSVDEIVCAKCGAKSISIKDLPGLTAAMAVARAKNARKLSGREIRFLRKAMGLRASVLAENLGVREETVSRWENDREPIGPASEKLLRLMVFFEFGQKTPGVDFDEKETIRMATRALRATGNVDLAFQLITMRVNKKRQQVWGEVREAA